MADNISALAQVLGEENVADLRKKLVDILIQKAEDDLDAYSEYLLYPPDFRDLVKDAMDATRKKVEKMYKDAMIDIHQDYIDKMKIYMSSQVQETSLRKEVYDLAKEYYWKSNEHGKERKFAEDLYKILGLTQEEILKEVEKNVGKEPEKEK